MKDEYGKGINRQSIPILIAMLIFLIILWTPIIIFEVIKLLK